MKLFRSLVIAAATFCSFNSIAGVITVNSVANKETQYWTYETFDDGIHVNDQTLMLPSVTTQFLLNSLKLQSVSVVLAKDASFSVDYDSWTVRYDAEFGFPLHSPVNKTLQDLSGFDADLFKSRPLQSGIIVNSRKFSDRYGFGVTLYFGYEFYRLIDTPSGGKHLEYASLSTNLGFYTESTTPYDDRFIPKWGKEWRVPELNDLMESVERANYRGDHIALGRFNCAKLVKDCLVSTHMYQLTQSVETNVQTETVPLPTTASFLLLGVAGLALRRRLTA